jgi:hypothetical protein
MKPQKGVIILTHLSKKVHVIVDDKDDPMGSP